MADQNTATSLPWWTDTATKIAGAVVVLASSIGGWLASRYNNRSQHALDTAQFAELAHRYDQQIADLKHQVDQMNIAVAAAKSIVGTLSVDAESMRSRIRLLENGQEIDRRQVRIALEALEESAEALHRDLVSVKRYLDSVIGDGERGHGRDREPLPPI